MGRFLFVVPPLEGHVNPTIGVAGELRRRGHEVAWVGHKDTLRRLLPPEAERFELSDGLPGQFYKEKLDEANRVRGLESFRFVFQDFFLPLARRMVPGVSDAVRRYAPSVMVVDQQAVAGLIVARQECLPWATSSTTAAGVVDLFEDLPKVRDWIRAQISTIQREFGLEPLDDPCDQSPHMVLVFSTKALMGRSEAYPDRIRFVGPAIGDRPDSVEFPWTDLQDRPRILVTLGTVNPARGRSFFDVTIRALAGSPYQGIIVAAENIVAAGMVKEARPDILVRQRIPQLAVLPHMDAVVCHGGQNTVSEALYFGLPLVVLPIKDDQTVIAQQVADAGAGIRLRFGRTSPAELLRAVDLVTGEPGYRREAKRIQASFRAAGGATAAARHLEELL